MRTSIRSSAGACAAAIAFAGLAGSAPADAGVIYSDTLTVYDGAGKVVDFVGATDAQESAGIFASSVAIDPSQFGNPTVLAEGNILPTFGYSDIVGVCTCGPGNGLALGFASDGDPGLIDYGQYPITIRENGPVDVTMYLDPGLRGQGYTAWFLSDGDVPEPATWALMLVGFGLAGAGLRRRAAVRTAA